MPAFNHTRHVKGQPATTMRHPRGYILASLAVLVLAAIVWYLLSKKPVTLSKTGYELAKALYAACNLEAPARLTAVMSKLEGESLSTDERIRVKSIANLAQNGDWQDAASEARNLLESQDSP